MLASSRRSLAIVLALATGAGAMRPLPGAITRPATGRAAQVAKVVWPPSWVPEAFTRSGKTALSSSKRAAKKTAKPKATNSVRPFKDPAVKVAPKAPSPIAYGDTSSAPLTVVDAVKANVIGGEPGKRGEVLVAAQFALLLCIAAGDVPVVGSLLRLDVGAALMAAGAGAMAFGALDLGPQLSPWLTPTASKGATLKTEGIYSICRHPMYAGLILLCGGLGVLADSFTRDALTVALGVVLSKKAAGEEELLFERFGAEYTAYKEEVPVAILPWILEG